MEAARHFRCYSSMMKTCIHLFPALELRRMAGCDSGGVGLQLAGACFRGFRPRPLRVGLASQLLHGGLQTYTCQEGASLTERQS